MQFPWMLLAAFTLVLLLQQATAQDCSDATPKCKKANGFCIGKKEECPGEVVGGGRKWCKGGKKCKCCSVDEPNSCGDGAEQAPCSILGGYCMNKDDRCEGREVFSQYFCSGSSCKCCIPQEDCASCEEKAGEQCGGEVFGFDFGGECKDFCEEGEMRLGDCGPNCGCCVPLNIPNGSCDEELEKACGGNPFGIPYSGTCRANCDDDEIRMGPCGMSDTQGRIESIPKHKQAVAASRMDDDCGCCVKMEFPTRK